MDKFSYLKTDRGTIVANSRRSPGIVVRPLWLAPQKGTSKSHVRPEKKLFPPTSKIHATWLSAWTATDESFTNTLTTSLPVQLLHRLTLGFFSARPDFVTGSHRSPSSRDHRLTQTRFRRRQHGASTVIIAGNCVDCLTNWGKLLSSGDRVLSVRPSKRYGEQICKFFKLW